MPPPTKEHSKTLEDKVALVSGSSSGIGAAIARELSSRGAHVVINYPFSSERVNAEKVHQSLRAAARSIVVEADLSSLEGPQKLVAAAIAEFGRIDILVNNAGITQFTPLDGLDDAEVLKCWDTVVNLNGRGTLLLTRATLKCLSSKDSRIINICSTTSRDPETNMCIYAGSKGMIESFTRCWARDLPRKYGCTVNTVAPGPVATEQLLSAPPHIREMIEAGLGRIPVAPRMATPEEIAWVVATLCEEKAGWLNGLYVPVTGGGTIF